MFFVYDTWGPRVSERCFFPKVTIVQPSGLLLFSQLLSYIYCSTANNFCKSHNSTKHTHSLVWATLLYLSIFSPARPVPGPSTNLTGRVWVEILKPAIFLHEPDPKCCFNYFTL
jgi:hypothetical protein